jgi:Flp pilus assembly protein TadG
VSTGSGRKTGSCSITGDEKGTILVEFAFSFIVLIILFLGTVTVGFAMGDYVAVQKVAREGAREACITSDVNRAREKALQAAWLWGLNPNNITIEFDQESFNNRILKACSVKYRTNLFNKTFPNIIGQASQTDYDINAKATFGWWDFTQ